MKRNKQREWILIAAFILIGIIVLASVIGLFKKAEPEPIEGWVELTDYRISSKVPGRVLKLFVSEGESVHRGDTLVIMQAPEIAAKMEQVSSIHSAAEAMKEKAYHGTRSEQIQGAYQVWQTAKAALVIAEKTYKRMNNLFEEGVLPAQKRDEALAQFQARTASEKAARSQYNMAVNGARVEDKEAASAQVRQAAGAMKEVKSYVNETVFTSPVDGHISEIFPEISELVGTGAPIMNVVDNRDVWFTFNIREDLLPNIQLNKKMKIYVSALNKTIPVRISLMKDIGSFAVWKATKSTGQFDLKTFEVQARPLYPVSGLHSGMSVILKE
jgi:HlyD family secretion protein